MSSPQDQPKRETSLPNAGKEVMFSAKPRTSDIPPGTEILAAQTRRVSIEPTTTHHKGYVIPPGGTKLGATSGQGTSQVVTSVIENAREQSIITQNPFISINQLAGRSTNRDLATISGNPQIQDVASKKSLFSPKRTNPIVKGVSVKSNVTTDQNQTQEPTTVQILRPVIKPRTTPKDIIEKVTKLTRDTRNENKMVSDPIDVKGKKVVVVPTDSPLESRESDSDNVVHDTIKLPAIIDLPMPVMNTGDKQIPVPLMPKHTRIISVRAVPSGTNFLGPPALVLTQSYSSDLILQTDAISGSTQNAQADLIRTVRHIITTNPIVIFSKSYCPFSRMAKQIFDKMDKSYRVIELDKRSDGQQIQDVLMDMTGARTVPRVFVQGQCLGGGMEVRDMYLSGELQKIVEKVQNM